MQPTGAYWCVWICRRCTEVDFCQECDHVPPQVEQQGSQLETFQQRNLLLQEENNVLKEKIHNLERYPEHTKSFF